jgi:uncharacterized membrane protein YhaH (DUF805 family)
LQDFALTIRAGGQSMSFKQAVSTCFAKYADFTGRARRSEYWYWVLFNLGAAIAARGLDFAVFRDSGLHPTASIYGLVVLLPGIAVTVRRLHDTDYSGWWLLLGLVPLFGAIILLMWLINAGTAGANRFGPDPLAGGNVADAPAAV